MTSYAVENTTVYPNYPKDFKSRGTDIPSGVDQSFFLDELSGKLTAKRNRNFRQRFSYSDRRSNTGIIVKESNVKTAVTPMFLSVNLDEKFYYNVFADVRTKKSEVVDLFNKVYDLFKEGKSDNAIVNIFDIVDDWFVDDNSKYDDLFQTFLGYKFNEDIYVALLASTISIGSNPFRRMYFKYVKDELRKTYNDNELEMVLSGL